MFFSFKAVMKKYLRLILEILLGVCFIAAATLAYMNYSAKKTPDHRSQRADRATWRSQRGDGKNAGG